MEIERGSPYKSLFALFICNRSQNPVTLKIIAERLPARCIILELNKRQMDHIAHMHRYTNTSLIPGPYLVQKINKSKVAIKHALFNYYILFWYRCSILN